MAKGKRRRKVKADKAKRRKALAEGESKYARKRRERLEDERQRRANDPRFETWRDRPVGQVQGH